MDFSRQRPVFSFEFFPPKTEQGLARFGDVVRALAPLRPHFVSVTFGAGGTSREGTYRTVDEIRKWTDLEIAPHLSCLGVGEGDVNEVLDRYRALGVRRVVALRGDLPKDGPAVGFGRFRYANELVAFIKERADFRISVGCYPEFHPQAPNPQADIDNFVRKVRAGADEAITQYFFNNAAYYSFVEAVSRKAVDIPIIVGLMPITDYAQIARFSTFCGADIPLWIRKRMESYAHDPASQRAFGIELATRQAEDLLRQGAPGIHFYTLNRAEATLRIWNDLGLSAVGSEHPEGERPAAVPTTAS